MYMFCDGGGGRGISIIEMQQNLNDQYIKMK